MSRRTFPIQFHAAVFVAVLLLALSPVVAQPSLVEQTRPIPILDSDHLNLGGNLHTPTPIIAYNGSVGRDVVFLYFHGGLWGSQAMNPYQNPCADGDNITVALIDPEDIGIPGNQAVDDGGHQGYVYSEYPRMGRVSPCSTDTHAYQYDSTGQKLGQVGGSWRHSHPFTDGGFLTDYSGRGGKFMIMSRGDNVSGQHDQTWLFRTTNWNARKAQWNAGIFPLVKVDSSVLSQVGHVSPIMLPPTPTATSVDGQGRRTVTWHGYFRWNGHFMGRIIVQFSPDVWGSVTPTRVSIEDQNGVFQPLGSNGLLTFVPKKVHKELTGKAGNPVQIYQSGSQTYLITREHQGGHNSNYPSDTNFPNCVPGTTNYNDIYLPQRGGTAYKIRIFPLTGPHQEGTPGTLSSSHRTVTGQLPTDYSVSMLGGGLLKVNGTTWFLSADRLDSICSRLSCAADGTPNTYCRLDVTASEVLLY